MEEAGITVFTGFAGSELLFEGNRVARRSHRRQRRGQRESPEIQLRARLRSEGQGRDSGRRLARLAHQTTSRARSSLIGTQSADLRPGHQRAVGGSRGRIAPGEVIYTMGWPLTPQRIRRRLDLRRQRQHRFSGFRHRPRLLRPALRSAARPAGIQEASLRRGAARRRQADSLRGQIPALRRLVGLASACRQWLDDHRRLCRVSELRAPERHPSRHQERHAGRGNRFRSSAERRFFRRRTLSQFQRRRSNPAGSSDELWKVRNFHQGFEHGFGAGMFSAGVQQITGGRGLRERYPSTPGYQRMKKLRRAAGGRRRRSASARPGQGGRQADLRQAHRPLSLRHQA